MLPVMHEQRDKKLTATRKFSPARRAHVDTYMNIEMPSPRLVHHLGIRNVTTIPSATNTICIPSLSEMRSDCWAPNVKTGNGVFTLRDQNSEVRDVKLRYLYPFGTKTVK